MYSESPEDELYVDNESLVGGDVALYEVLADPDVDGVVEARDGG